jgi:hypothetical protein
LRHSSHERLSAHRADGGCARACLLAMQRSFPPLPTSSLPVLGNAIWGLGELVEPSEVARGVRRERMQREPTRSRLRWTH